MLTKSLADTKNYAEIISSSVKNYRIVILTGDLGSGKTTLAQAIGEALGCDEQLTSPTFALSHRHTLPNKKILWHWDLYRLGSKMEIEGLGFFDEIQNKNSLHLIEWPEKVHMHLPRPFLEIHCQTNADDSHEFTEILHESPLPSPDEIEKLWDKYELPKNIRKHCKQVSRVGFAIAKKMYERGMEVDGEVVKISGLLHDLLRPLDFDCPREDNQDKISLCQKLKNEFGDLGHEEACEKLLKKMGYEKLAHTVGEHRFEIPKIPERLPMTLEGKLLNYADKRVKHAEIVSLEERFRDGRIRNAHLLDPDIDLLEGYYFQLEKEICALAGIKPEEIARLVSVLDF